MQKISYRFQLRKYANKQGERIILWFINIDTKQYKLSTGFRITEDKWDKARQRVKGFTNEANHINGELDRYCSDASTMIIKSSASNRNVSLEDFRKIVSGLVQSDKLIEFSRDKTNSLKGVLAPGTITRYETKIRILEKHEPDVTLGQVNHTYLLGLLEFLKKRNNGVNTIHTMFKTLSTLINHAIDDHLMENNPVPSFMRRYKIKAINGKRAWLIPDELKTLEHIYAGKHKESEMVMGNTTLSNTLKWYLFSCYTSLRYGDICNLQYKHIRKNGGEYPKSFTHFIDKVAEKNANTTPKQLLIPLVDRAVQLLPSDFDKNTSDKIWRVYTNQKVNKYLKEIAKAAEIEKKLTSHTARHTFAMISLNMDIPMDVVQELMAHSELNTTRIYAKMRAETKFRHMEVWQSQDENP